MNADDSSVSNADDNAAAGVRRFLLDLIAGYRRLEASPRVAAVEGAAITRRLTSLTLAEAAIRLSWPPDRRRERPRQLVVIGPTQAGKSTIVNVLAASAVAEVSPLAGFTVHAQGFWIAPDRDDDAWADDIFPDWRRSAAEELNREDLQTYTLCRVDSPFVLSNDPQANAGPSALPPCVIWDTPDFDSLSAGEYQRGVLEAAALADAYLLVLSKEKYSDLSVWNVLRLLEPLGRPLLVALNKLTPDSADVVTASLRQRLTEFTKSWGDVPIIPIPYCHQPGGGAAIDEATAAPLLHAATETLRTPRPPAGAGLRKLVRDRWEDWTGPVRAEHAVIDEWGQHVEAALQDFLACYQRDYLDHPHRYDAFRRAAVELLQLLEIPKLGGLIAQARRVVTWPARQLWQAGRAWRDARRNLPPGAHLGAEAAVLVDALETLLTGLQRDLARRSDPTAPGYRVWRAVAKRLREDEQRLRTAFSTALETHHAEVTREIQVVANELYGQLRRNPARLAALRGARATIDVGTLLVTVKTGGLSPFDAVWAPATFAFSSLLVEGFAGAQMAVASRGLKNRQRETVRMTLIEHVLIPELRKLAENLNDQELMGISAARLSDAERALRTWEQEDD